MKVSKHWFLYSILTVVMWGVWGALSNYSIEAGFPETMVYVVWALTMIPPAIVALKLAGWKLEKDKRAVWLGCAAGFLGAGGQLVLFKALPLAPSYLIFPFIALSPVITVGMALIISRERASTIGWIGIAAALVAGVLLSYSPPDENSVQGSLWIVLALVVLLAWGVQGFVISHANKVMRAESIFFYMMLTGILLIPVALMMTDFSKPINWSLTGPWMAAGIQLLNAVGALILVYAFRYGRAIIVAPLVNAAPPVLTIALALLLSGKTPHLVNVIGMIAAIAATVLMALEEETKPRKPGEHSSPEPAAEPPVTNA